MTALPSPLPSSGMIEKKKREKPAGKRVWPGAGSNRRPSAFQVVADPAEPAPRLVLTGPPAAPSPIVAVALPST